MMVVVLSDHLGLLMLLLQPAISHRNANPAQRSQEPALNLRFIRQPRTASLHLTLPASRAASSIRLTQRSSRKPPKPPPVERDAYAGVPPPETHSTYAASAPSLYPDNSSDGGFQQRLRNAQHSRTVRGLPGSDTPYVPGIRLIDPMDQGIAGVVHKMQRLLGVTNHHCVDVDVWRQLTPQELIARHISSDDVDKTDEKYGCNNPPGLHF